MYKPKFNLPVTLNDRVWTLHNNEVHSHFVIKVKAELDINGLNDRVIQTLVFDLGRDDGGVNVKTCRLEDVKESQLYFTKEDAVIAWLRKAHLTKTEAQKIIEELKERHE